MYPCLPTQLQFIHFNCFIAFYCINTSYFIYLIDIWDLFFLFFFLCFCYHILVCFSCTLCKNIFRCIPIDRVAGSNDMHLLNYFQVIHQSSGICLYSYHQGVSLHHSTFLLSDFLFSIN